MSLAMGTKTSPLDYKALSLDELATSFEVYAEYVEEYNKKTEANRKR